MVGILIVHFQQPDWLRRCLLSLRHEPTGLATDAVRIVVVDNASHGWIAADWEREFPEVRFLKSPSNTGFTGGNNLGWQWLCEHFPKLPYLMLLNPDTEVTANWLSPLVTRLNVAPHVAAVQPLIVLTSDPQRLNTAGNDCHYLGFGLLRDFGASVNGRAAEPSEIASVSGAAALLRADILRTVGLFDDRYFLYLEDTELSWKLRLAGYSLENVPASRVAHRFELRPPRGHYYFLERNRYWLLATYYRWWTLCLLLPAIVCMELGQWGYAAQQGLLTRRLRVWRSLLDVRGWRLQWQTRQRIQRLRRVNDRELTRLWSSHFPAELLPGWAVQRIANPLLDLYWRVVRRWL